jgi:hypothetical protein
VSGSLKGGTEMYINPFLAGVLFTIIVEILAVIVWAMTLESKENRRR